MSVSNSDQGLESVCPTCRNTNPIEPRILPCLHYFCTPCLRQVESTLRKNRNNNSNYLGNFLCPLCHQITPIFNISNFPLHKWINYKDELNGAVFSRIIKELCSPKTTERSSFSSSPNNGKNRRDLMGLLESALIKVGPQLSLVQRAKIQTISTKELFNQRFMKTRDLINGFYGTKDETRNKLLHTKLVESNRLSLLSGLIRRISILEQSETDLKYICEFIILILRSSRKNSDLCVINSFVNNIAKRLDDISEILDISEQIRIPCPIQEPKLALINCSIPLFEKVLCDVTLLIVDSDDIPMQIDDEFTADLSMTDQVLYTPTKIIMENNRIKLQFIPPKAGIALVIINYHGRKLKTSPNEIIIRPLALDMANIPNSSNSCNTLIYQRKSISL